MKNKSTGKSVQQNIFVNIIVFHEIMNFKIIQLQKKRNVVLILFLGLLKFRSTHHYCSLQRPKPLITNKKIATATITHKKVSLKINNYTIKKSKRVDFLTMIVHRMVNAPHRKLQQNKKFSVRSKFICND